MDTGMGTNAYSVIELKMVETILSNKADERRHMFEEAAGVNKYKLRRRLTLKRLDDVKGDLVRVNDIVSEVEKNVRSLHRQAKKANKYNQLQSLLREKELDLADREFSSSSSRLNQLVEYQKESNDKKEEVDVDIRKIENQLILFRESISSIENELSEKRIMLSVNTDKLFEVQKNISVAEEREKVLNRNIDNYKTELEELDVQQIENDELLENNKLKIVDIKEQIDQKNLVIEQNEQVLVEKKQSLDLQRDEVKAKSEKVSNIEKEISTLDNKINNAKDALDKTNNEVEKLNTFIQETTNNIAKTVGYLEELGVEKADVQRKVEISDSEYVQKQKEKETLEKELNNLREKELEEKNLL
ncbi:MAG: chromosome segregation protein SMC, partial [Candidatus Pacebacteria bacterium]|nr:chromosome segregation protein SMC [Candidatus Paceibacterota bacterium]